MSGKGQLYGENSKWTALHQLMRDKKIGVLAIQETHITDADITTIHDLYGRRLKVLHSPDPTAPTAARGVAFVLNRELVDVKNAIIEVVIPGRAVLLKMKWHAETSISLLNVYAPNHAPENENFWRSLLEAHQQGRLACPNAIVGDFNIVEEAIDRLPAREGPTGPVTALRSLMTALHLHDGWRITEPNAKDYTFPQRENSARSRLDRIYLPNELLNLSFEWEIESTIVPTDHRLASVRLTTAAAPFIGKGRWTMPVALLADQNFLKEAVRLGRAAHDQLRNCCQENDRHEDHNPQTVLKQFKEDVRAAARKIQKTKIPKLKSAKLKLERQLHEMIRKPDVEDDQAMQLQLAATRERILELDVKMAGLAKLTTATTYARNAERVSKFWSKINKDKAPRDLFFALRRNGTEEAGYETRSDKMAELARDYHEELQQQGIDKDETQDARQQAIAAALSDVDTSLPSEGATLLEGSITRGEVREALRQSAMGKATGTDGIPYEFWSAIDKHWEASQKEKTDAFDGLTFLTTVYQDIETFGTCANAGFADGWMCPLYKKKDRREIANYRPITLLNSDYKIYTKVLAMRLAKVVKDIVHPDQAGFIPGRQISDQTQLCRTMIDYAEATEENGVIIALDQEKAYDKIAHDYLWETLRAFGIPEAFTKRVQALYQHASTVVILNGETSSPFKVTRGVRQGDPLSCLVFDIAIEPLACALRASRLTGFMVPGAPRRLLASLFADDTSVFLRDTDRWSDLWATIRRWCGGSRARFNQDKTEVVPVGTPVYRETVRSSRCISGYPDADRIPESINIAKEGTAVRVLGAWIGNAVDQVAVWAPTLHKVENFLDRWGKCHPTLTGKKNIVQMGPGGITQYLTLVQGMPTPVRHTLNGMIRDFLWKGARVPPVGLDTLCLPIEEGGIGLLDLETRNEAIELTWLRRYLDLSPQRPVWAWAADVLISRSASADAGAITAKAQLNTFLQAWAPSLGPRSSLPRHLKDMLRVAKKHHACFAAIKLSRKAKKDLPIWYHLGASRKLRAMNNAPMGKCLREHHGVGLVADLIPLQSRPCLPAGPCTESGLRPWASCECRLCAADAAKGCRRPQQCCRFAASLLQQIRPRWHPDAPTPGDGLSLTRHRKESNENAVERGEDLTFDPSVTSGEPLAEAFRVFVDPEAADHPPAIRRRLGRTVPHEACTVFIVAQKERVTQEGRPGRAVAGFALCEGAQEWSAAVHADASDGTESCGSGEVVAALHAALRVPHDAPLHLVSSSPALRTVLFKNRQRWEDAGWQGIRGAPYMRTLINQLRQRCAPTTLGVGTGEQKRSLERATHLSTEAAQAGQHALTVRPRTNPAFELTGAKLSTLSQAQAYWSIRERKPRAQRPTTARTVDKVLTHLNRTSPRETHAEGLWKSIRHPDFQRKIVDFLWKIMHGAHRVGSYWEKIPGYEQRGTCAHCGARESMEHILFECAASGREAVWSLTRSLWEATGRIWPGISLEGLLGVGIIANTVDGPRTRPQAARL